jgi:hypothetical protein
MATPLPALERNTGPFRRVGVSFGTTYPVCSHPASGHALPEAARAVAGHNMGAIWAHAGFVQIQPGHARY